MRCGHPRMTLVRSNPRVLFSVQTYKFDGLPDDWTGCATSSTKRSCGLYKIIVIAHDCQGYSDSSVRLQGRPSWVGDDMITTRVDDKQNLSISFHIMISRPTQQGSHGFTQSICRHSLNAARIYKRNRGNWPLGIHSRSHGQT